MFHQLRLMLGFVCLLGLLVGCGAASGPDTDPPDNTPDGGPQDPGDCPGRQCQVQVLAEDLPTPEDLVVAGGQVYWLSPSAKRVSRVSVSGGRAETVATVEELHQPLATDGTSVYWAAKAGAQNGLWRAPVAGSTPELFQPLNFSLANSLHVTGAHVYWSNGTSVSRVPKQGGALEPVLVSSSVLHFAVDARGIYYFDAPDLLQLTPGGSPVPLAQLPNVFIESSIVADEDFVYGTVWTFTPNGSPCESSRIMRVPKGGGEPQRLGEFQTCVFDIAVDDSHVYALGFRRDGSGAPGIVRIPRTGGAAETVVEGTGMVSAHLALDATHVYWTDSFNGRVLRVPKP